jgi:uncharacterized membrane protein YfhO
LPPGPTVTVTEATFNTYAVHADVLDPSLLVFRMLYDKGRRAFVDGNEVEIVQAEVAFQAVRVDPGSRHVRFVYDPMSFKIGAAMSALGLVVSATALGWRCARAATQRRSYQTHDGKS